MPARLQQGRRVGTIRLVAAFLWTFCSACAWAQTGAVSAFDRAVAEDLPGKYETGACLPFARELYSRFSRAGTEAHLIAYGWRSRLGESGIHAFVVYRDEEGRYWGMDNLRHQPLWLGGSTPLAWSGFFSPYTSVTVRAHLSNRAKAARTVLVSTVPRAIRKRPVTAPVPAPASAGLPRSPDEATITNFSRSVPSHALALSEMP